MSSKRMTANPIKAARYRPGKAVEEAESSDSEASSLEEEAPQTSTKSAPKFANAPVAKGLNKVDLEARRKAAADAEAQRIRDEQEAKAKAEEGFVTESEEEGSESGSEDEEDSEEESSEEEVPRRMMRPTFIKKSQRSALATKAVEVDPEIAARDEEERRKAAADAIVEEQIARDLAAKAAGKKNWDDDEEENDDVDTEDDVDPEAEYAAWKLRELQRVMRERKAVEEREAEIAEIERRRNLTDEERKAEDEAYLKKQEEERGEKGEIGFMQQYHHKGAFFQDEAKELGLADRNLVGRRFVDETDRSLLPQSMQLRDMTKLGKKGATKYKDLKSEDTGRWADFGDQRRGGPRFQGDRGGDERFRSDYGRDGEERSGSNNMPLGPRRTHEPSRDDRSRDERPRDDRERYDRPRDEYRREDRRDDRRSDRRSRSPRRRRSYSRSRSPRRDRHGGDYKRRLSRESDDGDKRRRLD